MKSLTTTKKLWIGIGVLALLSPLGAIIPALSGAGGAWGEWGLDAVEKLLGYVPEGMKRLAHAWKSPMPDYSVPGQGQGLMHKSMGYGLTAVIGIAFAAGLAYLVAKVLSHRARK